MNIEHRNLQIRASQGDEFVLVGRALTYNQVSSNELAPGLRERMTPGCFKETIVSGRDVKALLNHDSNSLPLGRTANGTLTLTDSESGLDMRVQLDRNNSLHRDVYASVKRGDISEMSFAFVCEDEDVSSESYQGRACQVRNVRKAQLHDVSVVTSAFYGNNATAVATRNAGASVDELRARLLAMPGDWARQQRAHEITLQLLDEKRRDASEPDEGDDGDDDDLETLRKALLGQFGKGEHGLPKYFPVELNGDKLVIADVWHLNPAYHVVPVHQDDSGHYTFGIPKELIDYFPKGRAGIHAHEARQGKADAELRFRMRAAAGI